MSELIRFDNLSNFGVKNCSMFAVYDGHGGADCCNFLKENLHTYVLNTLTPSDLKASIKQSCNKLDGDFMKKCRDERGFDTSGSCGLALIIIGRRSSLDNNLVFVNVGDSRAVLSKGEGAEVQICTYDHKPQFFGEMQRVFKNGGQLYR